MALRAQRRSKKANYNCSKMLTNGEALTGRFFSEFLKKTNFNESKPE